MRECRKISSQNSSSFSLSIIWCPKDWMASCEAIYERGNLLKLQDIVCAGRIESVEYTWICNQFSGETNLGTMRVRDYFHLLELGKDPWSVFRWIRYPVYRVNHIDMKESKKPSTFVDRFHCGYQKMMQQKKRVLICTICSTVSLQETLDQKKTICQF